VREVKVADVMTSEVVTVTLEDTLHEAAGKLADHRVSGLPVVDGDRVVGIVSESDVVETMSETPGRRSSLSEWLQGAPWTRREDPHPLTVRDAMTPDPVTISQDADVWDAADLIARRDVNRLPVVDDDDRLVGIVTRGDLVRVMGRDDDSMREDVAGAIRVLGEESFEDLGIEVTDGVARLTGVADRKSTMEIAERLAQRVPGVTKVVNDLEFEIDDSKLDLDRDRRAKDRLQFPGRSRRTT
jgi:CBS domain-containing protein